MRSRLLWLLLFVQLTTGAIHAQTVRYVDADAVGSNNGSSWTNAFTDLQAAIAAANELDEIWIAEGMYKPTAGMDRSLAFELDTSVSWYGGFGGWETDFDQRDWVLHPTILSGNIGDPGDSTDNSYHVVYGYLDYGYNVVDGFIIEDGQADGNIAFGDIGGGLSVENSDLQLRNCIVRRCYAEGSGGGVNVSNSRFSMLDVQVEDCVCRSNGGGAHLWNGYGLVERCEFLRNRSIGSINSSNGMAGGLLVHGGFSPRFCSFEHNYSNTVGGALFQSNGIIANCRFVGNTARKDGGAIISNGQAFVYSIYECSFINNRVLDLSFSGGAIRFDGGTADGSRANVYASYFIGNQATQDGGAIYCNNVRLRIHSSIFDGNSSGRNGGAMAYSSGAHECRILNSTFVHNDAGMQGKALYDWSLWYDSTLVINSIFWDNAQPEIEHHPNGHALDMRRSIIQSLLPGTDLYDFDPLFVDQLGPDGLAGTEDDDLHLTGSSPSIDLGTPDTTGLGLFFMDAGGDMRIMDIVDLGAYELQDCGLAVSNANLPTDTLVCAGLLYLQADIPLVGIGTWRVLGNSMSGLSPTPQIEHPLNSPLMRFSVLDGDSYFEWSVAHCGVITRDTVRVTRLSLPTAPTILSAYPEPLCPGGTTVLSVEAANGDVEWSTGESGASITVGPGSYTARIVNTAGCDGPWSAPLVVNGATAPNRPIIIITGSVDLCENTGQSVQLSAGSTQAEYLWSNGATSNSITVDSIGTFTVTVTNGGGCSSLPSLPVDVLLHQQPPAPLLTLASDTAFCTGGSVVIAAAVPATSYVWSTGSTSNAIIVSSSGNYFLRISDAFGCVSTSSDTIAVIVHPVVSPTIVASGPTAFCFGDSVIMHTDPLFTAYAWSNGSTDPSIIVSTSGPNTVIVSDANGCTSTSINSPVQVYPLPSIPVIFSIFVSTEVLNLSTSFLSGATYAWYRNGVLLPSATSYQLNGITQVGPYVVVITDQHGCSSTSASFAAPVGIEDHTSGPVLRVFPNPSDGHFNIYFGTPAGTDIRVDVLDRTGRLVYHQRRITGAPDLAMEIDLSEICDGSYLVRINSEQGTASVPIAITR